MQPKLPTGFESWAQVLTDWSVSGAFQSCPLPRCFAYHPELAAPSIAEISAAIREKQLRDRPLEAAIHREKVTEPAYDRIGGPSYLDLRSEMESTQERYFARRRASDSVQRSDSKSALLVQIKHLQSDFFAFRRRHETLVEQTRSASVRAYWAANPARGLGDTFFDEFPTSHPASRMSRIAAAWWWREFFARLQTRLARYHAADGCFLDTLPSLRAKAKKKTLAALIAEWSAERRDTWGWDGPGHYRMLADRTDAKARAVGAWFNQCAPGYLADESVRAASCTTIMPGKAIDGYSAPPRTIAIVTEIRIKRQEPAP